MIRLAMSAGGIAAALAAAAPGPLRAADPTSAPASSIRGELVSADGSSLPAFYELRLRRGPTPVPAAVLRCPVTNGRLRCAAPAGTFDLELRSEGTVPHYRWDVVLTAGRETDLGRLAVRKGASLSGTLAGPDGTPPLGPCRVEVEALRLVAPAGARGFFQLAVVPPGRHALVARCPGGRATRAVEVPPRAEARLAEPMVVDGLTLALRVVPPLDPSGAPWRVNLLATTRGLREVASGAAVGAGGRWERPGLLPGSYEVKLTTQGGLAWLSRSFELSERSGPLLLEAPGVKVAGIVLLAGQPLRARLVFGDDAGTARVTLESGEHGLFEGHLPATAEAREAGWAVEVHSASPPVNHRLEHVVVAAAGESEAQLELVVPGASARGTVRAEDGSPQEGAQVVVEALTAGLRDAVAYTSEAGVFELVGLPAGPYRITAEGPHGLSEPREVTIGEGPETELELVLKRRKRLLQGQVTAQGEPVPGAVAHVWLPPGAPKGSTSTDPEGRFEVALPTDLDEVALTIGAPGYALKMVRVVVRGADPIRIDLDRVAGTLVLEAPAGESGRGEGSVVLAHQGALQTVAALSDWGAQNGAGPDGDLLVVPAVEPGRYSLCRVTPREVQALWQGGDTQRFCRSGSLAPGGRLSLSLP